MATTIRRLSGEEIRALTPENFQLAPVFHKQAVYAGEMGVVLVGEVDGVPAAAAAGEARGEWLQVDEFVVSPRFRGHGLGGSLMRAVLTEARRRGLRKVRAFAPSWCPEWRAFYTRLGFVYREEPLGEDDMGDMVAVELDLDREKAERA
jgi:GNAT superfamily N-acetyltransferase